MASNGNLTSYLDYVRNLDPVRAYKQIMLELMQARAGSKVLDVGCGTGDDVRELALLVGERGLVVGIDHDENMIAEALRRSEHSQGLAVDFVREDAHSLQTIPSQAFDICRFDRVLQHVENPRQVLDTIARVLQNGGVVVGHEPDWETFVVSGADQELTRRILHFMCDTVFLHGRIGSHLAVLYRSAGFADIEVIGVTGVFQQFQQARQIFRLDQVTTMAESTSIVSREEIQNWSAQLSEADAAGEFFSSITSFIVKGQKP